MSNVGRCNTQNGSLASNDKKPLVTYILVAFNQEKYIEAAVESALTQTYKPIQFIFSDDCSSDRTFDIMLKTVERYAEIENIVLNRNEVNLGVVDHLNKLITGLAKGTYFVFQAGDDITTPDRTDKIVACFESTKASAVAINPQMIDGGGKSLEKDFLPYFPNGVLNFKQYFVNRAPFFGGGGYSRDIFDVYGPMKNNVRNEDQILPFRACTLGGIAYLSDPVYFYREHGENLSYWVKIKRDRKNQLNYEVASRRNALQNLLNFRQEVNDSYPGKNKHEMLPLINLKIDWMKLETELLGSPPFSRLKQFPAVFKQGKGLIQTVILLLVCLSPVLYLNMRYILKALRGRLSSIDFRWN